jgi:hypothetical protein
MKIFEIMMIVIKISIDGLQQAISLKDPQWREWIAAMLGEKLVQSFLDTFLENL